MTKKKIITLVSIILAVIIVVAVILISVLGRQSHSYNKDKVFRLTDTWEKSALVNHYHGGTNIGPLEYFGVEGLYRNIRVSDEIVCLLAEEPMTHEHDAVNGDVSTVKIRDNAKWQNGDDFVAQDVMAFYYLNHTAATNYMLSLEAVTDKVLKIHWNPNRPISDNVKNYLVAQDRQGTVQYLEFQQYADRAKSILDASPEIPADSTTWGAFNKYSTVEQIAQLNANYADFTRHNPAWFVCTGPFMIDTVTPTQMILVKNPLHWNADNIGFEKVIAYSISDVNQQYNMLINNEVDYVEGSAPIDTLKSIIAGNENLVHIKTYDPGTVGLTFNFENSIWSNEKVREAFQYIFNREEIRNLSNPYAEVVNTAPLAAAPNDVKNWITQEHYSLIKTYNYDQSKAEQLLKEAGWTKNSGRWHRENGEQVKLYLGTDGDSAGMSAAVDVVQAELNSFGIECIIKKTDHNNFNANAYAERSPYDMTLFWTSLNLGFSYPSGYLSQFEAVYSKQAHLPHYDAAYKDPVTGLNFGGRTDLTFEYLGEKTGTEADGTMKYAQYIDYLYALDEEKFESVIASIFVGLSEYKYGVNFYQNVTGGFYNKAMIDGLPLESYWSNDRNVTYVPALGTQDCNDTAILNKWFGGGVAITNGMLQPTKEK